MKSHYTGLWLLVALSLIIFLIISFADDISIGPWTVKKAPFADRLLNEAAAADSLQSDSVATELPAQKRVETDSTAKSIFIFGDSMTWNLALRLAQYAKQNGHTIHALNWDSSNTKTWSGCDTLVNNLKRYKVDYVFITLGSNELYLRDPNARLENVKQILAMIDTIPYVWIGPPNWKEDTGFNDMLARTCRPGSFFRTGMMKLDRKADHIHPTKAASAIWVDSIVRWLPKSAHPILMDVPSDTIGKVNPNIQFLKALNK